MGQYFTPNVVINFMVAIANPTSSDLVLDPFCGSGHFLTHCLNHVRRLNPELNQNQINKYSLGKLHGIEKSDRMVRIAMTSMRLNEDGHCNIRNVDALLNFDNYNDLQPGTFDVVLTNPPFGSILRADAIAELGEFELSKNRKSVPIEVLGLERAIQFLRPGGRMGIVLPESILATQKFQYVRKWLARVVSVRGIVSLPVEAFSPFGANIRTSILFCRKLKSGEVLPNDYLVFMGSVDNVGYDATGRNKDGLDIWELASEFHAFIREEGW